MKRENCFKLYNEADWQELEAVAADYRQFLSLCKTERESVREIVQQAEAAGYISLEAAAQAGRPLLAGAKVYSVCMGKAVALFRLGRQPLTAGLNILGAHIDSPRLDIKQNPLFEEGELAFLDTHYYGGVKKYQWVTIPLAIHGVVVKKDGTTVEVSVGEKDEDPVFFVSDLLIHLAQEQLEKKANKVIEGEALDIIVGNRPLVIEKKEADGKNEEKGEKEEKAEKAEKAAEKDAVKKGILDILQKSYGIEEEDFISAELEVVPAGRAREAGFDRSMILAYGQDDRVCAFTSLKAMLEIGQTARTACCILVDKEEIGSVGATGMQSRFFENAVAEVMNLTGEYSELNVRRCLARLRLGLASFRLLPSAVRTKPSSTDRSSTTIRRPASLPARDSTTCPAWGVWIRGLPALFIPAVPSLISAPLPCRTG